MRFVVLLLLLWLPSVCVAQDMDDAALRGLYLECVEHLEQTVERDGWNHHRERLGAARYLYSTHRERARGVIAAEYELPKPKHARIWERVHAVVTMGGPETLYFFPRVLAALDAHKESFLMERAALALPQVARGNEARAVEALRQIVAERSGTVSKVELTRRCALQSLAALGDAGALDELAQIYAWEGGDYFQAKDHPTALWMRMQALEALIEADRPGANLDLVRAWTRHTDKNVRRHATRLIAEQGAPDDLPLLERGLDDPEPMVRKVAADGVARLGQVALAQAIMSEDALEGSLIALRSLAEWGTPDAIPTLRLRMVAERERARTRRGADRFLHYTTGTLKLLIERHHPALAKQALSDRSH